MSQEYARLINTLSDESLKKVLLPYLKEKYDTRDVRITDGPYDGGNDLEIEKDGKVVKKNIQLFSGRSSVETKLDDDCSKAANNVAKHAYLNRLDFYCTQTLSKSTRDKLETMCLTKYNVEVKVYDANLLGADANEYDSLRQAILDVLNFDSLQGFNSIAKHDKVLFDILSKNKEFHEVQKHFLYSVVFAYLYEHPSSTILEVTDGLNEILAQQRDAHWYEQVLHKLRSEHLLKAGETSQHFSLSDEQHSEIDKLYNATITEEKILQGEFASILGKHAIALNEEEVLEKLKSIYQEHYEVDISEIQRTGNSFEGSIKKVYTGMVKFFCKAGFQEDKARTASHELLEVCGSSSYLSKLALALMFTKLYSSNRLEKFLSNEVHRVVLDTQVLIRLLCILKSDNIEFNDADLRSIQEFNRVRRQYSSKLEVITTFDYVEEVTGHVFDALRLSRLLSLPIANRLGKSSNVFVRYVAEMKLKVRIEEDETLESILSEIVGLSVSAGQPSSFSEVSKRLEKVFGAMQIHVYHHPFYPDFDKYKREYEINLAHIRNSKKDQASEYDLRTILYLANQSQHELDDVTVIPHFVTWDSRFYSMRQTMLAKFNNLSYWFIYSPAQFADKMTVQNLSINPKAVNGNIVSIVESGFNAASKHSFIDVLSQLFNKEDLSEIGLINKIVDLKDRIKPQEELFDSPNEPVENGAIEETLLRIRAHYVNNTADYSVADLTGLFEDGEYADEIVRLIEEGVGIINSAQTLNGDFFAKFNALMFKQKKRK